MQFKLKRIKLLLPKKKNKKKQLLKLKNKLRQKLQK